MSSSEILQEILEFKKKIEKDLKVNNILLIIFLFKQDEETIIKILKRLAELDVTKQDIKVNIFY